MKFLRVFILVMVLSLVMVQGASATDYYVNNSHPFANDSNDGTIDLPRLTIQSGIGLLSDYDTLYVIGGGTNYTGEIIFASTTIADNTSVIGINNPICTHTAQVFNIGAHGNIGSALHNFLLKDIDGYSTTNSGSGALSFSYNSGGSSNITLDNVNIYSAYIPAVMFRALSNTENITIKNSIVEGSAGITTQDDWGNKYLTLYNNTITAKTSQNDGIMISRTGGDYANISNNTIVAAAGGIHILDQSTGTDMYYFEIRNNTISAGLNTEGTGIWVRRGQDFIVDGNHILYSTYTGIKPAGESYNGTYSNNILEPDGYDHNAYELAGVDMHWFGNSILGVNKSKGDAWNPYYSPGSYPNTRLLIENNTANDTVGFFIVSGGHVNQSIYRNMDSVNTSDGGSIKILGYDGGIGNPITSNNLVFDNISVENNDNDAGVYLYQIWSPGSNTTQYLDWTNYTTDNITFIDIKNTGTNPNTAWYINDGGLNVQLAKAEIHAINVDNVSSYWAINYPDECEVVLHEMYYLNAKVVDGSGTPIENAVFTFEANVTNPETGAILKPHNGDYGDVSKAYTDELDVAYTNANGLTDTRFENATNTVALTAGMQYYTTSEQYQAVEWNVTATYDGVSTSQIITVSSADYSPDPSDLQGTLYTFTLDADTEEPATPTEDDSSRTEGAESALAMVGVLLVILVATAIIGSLVGLMTGVLDSQASVLIIFTFLAVAVLGYIGLAVLSGISGALNL